MSTETLQVNGCTVRLLGVIKGLKSEAATVQRAFEDFRPDKVAVSLSKEELAALDDIPEDFEPLLSRYEEIYAEGLSRFGEVSAPPPCYVAALELSKHAGVPVIPVDLDERSFTELYCATISGPTLFRHSTRTWLLKRRRFSDKSPEEFVYAWDRAVNGLEGFRKIEVSRAEAMAKGIVAACADASKVLAVIELERADDVREFIKERAGTSTGGTE